MQIRISHERVGPGMPASRFQIDLIKPEEDGTKSVLVAVYSEGGSASNLAVITADNDNEVLSQLDYDYCDSKWNDCKGLCTELYALTNSVHSVNSVARLRKVEKDVKSPAVLVKLAALFEQSQQLSEKANCNLQKSM